MAPRPIIAPVPVIWYPTLSVLMIATGLVITASFLMCVRSDLITSSSVGYEATSTRRNRNLSKELLSGAVASVFSGFGFLFLLLACGVYV